MRRFFFGTLVVARRTRTILAQEWKIEVAGVAVGPGDVDPRAGFDVNLHGDGLFAWIDRRGHAWDGAPGTNFPF